MVSSELQKVGTVIRMDRSYWVRTAFPNDFKSPFLLEKLGQVLVSRSVCLTPVSMATWRSHTLWRFTIPEFSKVQTANADSSLCSWKCVYWAPSCIFVCCDIWLCETPSKTTAHIKYLFLLAEYKQVLFKSYQPMVYHTTKHWIFLKRKSYLPYGMLTAEPLFMSTMLSRMMFWWHILIGLCVSLLYGNKIETYICINDFLLWIYDKDWVLMHST